MSRAEIRHEARSGKQSTDENLSNEALQFVLVLLDLRSYKHSVAFIKVCLLSLIVHLNYVIASLMPTHAAYVDATLAVRLLCWGITTKA